MFPSLPTCASIAKMASIAKVSMPFKRSQEGLFHGKLKQYGNNVPFSKHKTRRTWLPNVQSKRLVSDALGKEVKVKLTTRALKTINKYGSIDQYLLRTKPELLGWEGMRLRILVREQLDAKRAVEEAAEKVQAKKKARAQEKEEKQKRMAVSERAQRAIGARRAVAAGILGEGTAATPRPASTL
ncbi:hypothetical protein BV22DRAFT_1004987 [Leucogyrophana mollusca]|uniref:Uncharacterized protein n=1 Tax=Leucogyrophana mollusca TaxID=85980 RepID=A0ACB8BSX2_9AGAM|nr:hypothetical protein BV22DRAFT_1004987 [Leucogyrophana mollusca]